MATVNNWLTAISGTTKHGNYEIAAGDGRFAVVKKRYFAAATNNMSSGEYYKIFDVPADCIVRSYIFTGTVEGGTATIDVSFITDADTTAASEVAMVNNHNLNSDDALSAGTVIANDSAGYIVLKPENALDAATFWVVVECMPLASTD